MCGVLAALTLLPPAPAIAMPAPAPAAVAAADRVQALGAWVKEITDALGHSNEASMAYSRALQDFAGNGNEAQVRAGLPKIRAANARMRDALARSEVLLGRVRPFDKAKAGSSGPVLDRVLQEARSQVQALRQLVLDTEGLAAAMERGDRAAVALAAPKLARAGFVQLRGQAAMYRARQAIAPPERATHQMASVTIALYEAMSVAAESWYAARVERRPGAASEQRARLVRLADDLEQEVRIGRSNLARDVTAFAAAGSNHQEDRSTRALSAAMESIGRVVGEAFTIGDEIVRTSRSGANVTDDALAAQAHPQLVAELSILEQRYVALMAQAAAAMARPGG
jgi:hypothetical protein